MARNQRNLKPDIILKNYWRDNARFADLFNAVLFQGEQVIQPHELEDLDTESSTILEHKKQAEGIAASRDNIKIKEEIHRIRDRVCNVRERVTGVYRLCHANEGNGL